MSDSESSLYTHTKLPLTHVEPDYVQVESGAAADLSPVASGTYHSTRCWQAAVKLAIQVQLVEMDLVREADSDSCQPLPAEDGRVGLQERFGGNE